MKKYDFWEDLIERACNLWAAIIAVIIMLAAPVVCLIGAIKLIKWLLWG